MQRVGEHPVPAGPLAVRWIAYELGEARAGLAARARLRLANAGSAPWRSVGREGIQLSYHWLDPLGNPIVWDGPRTPFDEVVRPGEEVELETAVLAPRSPGSYRLAFDLVAEYRYWFEELGSATLDLPVEVRPRIEARRLASAGARRARLRARSRPRRAGGAAREPRSAVAVAHLVPGARSRSRLVAPDPRRPRRGVRRGRPALEPDERGARRRLSAWAPGGGRNPRFDRPLLLPSVLAGIELDQHEGLPAYDGADGLFEGRAVIRLRSRSGRPSG